MFLFDLLIWCRILIQDQVWSSWKLKGSFVKKKLSSILTVAEILALDYIQMKNM